MTQKSVITFLFILLFSLPLLSSTDVWLAHVTTVAGWKTWIAAYNSGPTPITFTLTRWNDVGVQIGSASNYTVAPKSWTILTSADLNYNGSAHLVSSQNMLFKASFQFGDSPSVCEFYLGEEQKWVWVIPNSVRTWLDYTGIGLVNGGDASLAVTLEAWRGGVKVTETDLSVPARGRYVSLSDSIWPDIHYTDFDTAVVRAAGPLPAPISISGNNAGDRHLFFTAQPSPQNYGTSGDLIGVDSIVGNLHYARNTGPSGFLQGSPVSEPGRFPPGGLRSEDQFTHILTRSLAVMETEATRQMWADLRSAQPTLPADPSNSQYSPSLAHPLSYVTWSQAVLFANLLSVQQGLTRCYYTDATKAMPISAANYTGSVYYCDFDASGYRLPTEGEWEYFSRAGTSTPFWKNESNYKTATMGSCTAGALPALESAGWFCANAQDPYSHPPGGKQANPWNLLDTIGNVEEMCWDYLGYYPIGTVTDYTGPASGSNRVARGGGCYMPQLCRSAARSPNGLGGGSSVVFRLVRTVID